MKINCIAIDDEPLALDKIREYIKRIGYLNLLSTFENAVDALEFLKENQVDLIFLDIQMEELTGIQMLETLQVKPKVVLTTAYDEYALKGYELDVCDYLLKPISFQRFLQACEKVYKQIDPENYINKEQSVTHDNSNKQNYFFVKNGNKTQKIDFDEILFVEGMKDYLRIWTHKEKVMTLLSFKKLEDILPPDKFIRIHKSYLIAIDKIESIERNRIKMAGERLPIGNSYRREFYKIIENRQAK
ncbi:MAG: LytTR family DNA-binding domain-containing protein [Bacteroidales bacterium]|nr:LytTR family DNA-binding domain-containing protein [Bacteroidales bacterium]